MNRNSKMSAEAGDCSLKHRDLQTQENADVIKRPPEEPMVMVHGFLMSTAHICRNVILLEPETKVTLYLVVLVIGSFVCHIHPVPESYFSEKSNVLNQVFVKRGWGWTLALVGPYLGLTSYVYCCGSMRRIMKHFLRLLVGTLAWFFWTKLFVFVHANTPQCLNDEYLTKTSCIEHGYSWVGFDISGHAFMLIYCSLIILEETKSIEGWEKIGEFIRSGERVEDGPLKSLTSEELKHLRRHYKMLTPYILGIFVALVLLSVLWDVMLVATILYFHDMLEKIVGGAIAVYTWFATYRLIYAFTDAFELPGKGLFNYNDTAYPTFEKTPL